MKAFVGLDGGIKGTEKIAFPYMRQFMKNIYKASFLSVKGVDGNNIDAVLLSGAAIREILNQGSHSGTITPSKGMPTTEHFQQELVTTL